MSAWFLGLGSCTIMSACYWRKICALTIVLGYCIMATLRMPSVLDDLVRTSGQVSVPPGELRAYQTEVNRIKGLIPGFVGDPGFASQYAGLRRLLPASYASSSLVTGQVARGLVQAGILSQGQSLSGEAVEAALVSNGRYLSLIHISEPTRPY